MATEREVDKEMLKIAASNLEEDGYTVLLEPSSEMLPLELKDLHPDGIAIGKKPHLVIEVTREGARHLERVKKLQKAIGDNGDWQLQLLFTGAKPPDDMDTLPLAYIEDTVRSIESVAKEDARPALLMCWAYLEALARSLDPKSLARPQTPGRIVEQLASLAYIGAIDAEFLRDMAEKRNKFVHGQLTTKVERAEVSRFIGIIENVIRWVLTRKT